jgi:GntR family transcriptional regulator
VRVVDGTPAAIQESWLSYAVAPGIAREELVDGSLYRTLAERWGLRVRWAEQEISATPATSEQAEWLEVAVGSPLVAIIRRTFGDGSKHIEYARSWTRPEFPLIMRLDA